MASAVAEKGDEGGMNLVRLSVASKLLDVPSGRLRKWILQGVLPAQRDGGYYVVVPADVERVIDERNYRRTVAMLRRGKEAAREYGPIDRQVPPHLLPALHLFIRAVATGLDFSAFNDTRAGNPFRDAARRVILVERKEDAARIVTRRQALACLEEDARPTTRWNGRRWSA